jgi:hypothetical protein
VIGRLQPDTEKRTLFVHSVSIHVRFWRIGGSNERASGYARRETKDIVETQFISELARKLARAVPGSGEDLATVRADLERNFRGLLTGAFDRMDLVTREEFDIQRRVLERSREKLVALEARVAELEQQQAETGGQD